MKTTKPAIVLKFMLPVIPLLNPSAVPKPNDESNIPRSFVML